MSNDSPTHIERTDSQRAARRLRAGAFLTLFGILLAHALLETARDALFLANIAPEQLPWVYLLIAGSAFALARATTGADGHGGHKRWLVGLQLLAAAGTGGFWVLARNGGDWVYYALYVWAGVITSVLVTRFWLSLSDAFTITQGKQAYASIATGGSTGALAGFALATALSSWLPAEWLILASALFYALSALGPSLLFEPTAETRDSEGDARADAPGLLHSLGAISREPLARRVAALMVLTTFTFTLSDFLFKSVVVEYVEKDALARWLGSVYLGLNVGSLLVLTCVVTPMLRRVSIHRALAVLPLLVSLAATALVAGGGLVAIVLLKCAEGTLRFSLQKTAGELLYLPMRTDLRASVKYFGELLGAKGARALASIGILLVVPLPDHVYWIALAVVGLALLWSFAALALRGPYLDTFRRTLSEGSIETCIDYPELDLASLETLIRALNHPDEQRVLAALQLLADKQRVELIPSLILYHPSTAVVTRALELFAIHGRDDFWMHADRLLDHPDATARAAATRALWSVSPDRARLEELSRSECPCIRVSAVTGRVAHAWIDPEEAIRELEAALADPDLRTRLAVAAAARLRYAALYREPLVALSRDADAAVRLEAVLAMGESGDAFFTSPLVALLDDRSVREEVREVLVARGETALEALARALHDPRVGLAIRRHVPATLARFGTPRAARILLESLEDAGPGVVRYAVVRALVRLLSGPSARMVDRSPVARAVDRTLERALALLYWEAELVEGQQRDPTRETTGGELLRELLRDKGRLATQRIFMLLGLLHEKEDFRDIWSGLESGMGTVRASSEELLEHLLPVDQRRAVLALVSQDSAPARLRASGSPHAERKLSYARLLDELTADESKGLRAFALYHAAELDLEPRPAARGAATVESVDATGPIARLRERALGLIQQLPEASARPAAAAGESRG